MKIMINYDLINAIRNVNEELVPFKIVRNRKNDYLSFLPIYTLLNLCNGDSLLEMIGTLGLQYGMVLSIDMVLFALYKNMVGDDFYTKKSSDDLKKLVGQLDALNISTSYDLLLKSEVYEKNIKWNLINSSYLI